MPDNLLVIKKIKVNGVSMQVPSFQLYPGDLVSVDKEAQNQMRHGDA